MKVDLINGDEVLIKISGATIIISKVSAILLRDHLSKLVEEKFTAGRTLQPGHLQQLKAEIADFVNAVQQNGDDKNLRHNVDNFVGRVRQLSAI
jgi:hypothetical protein